MLKEKKQDRFIGPMDAFQAAGFSDEELSKKTRKEIFNHYLNWNGLIGYADEIISVIEGIYNVELLEEDEK